MHDCIPLEAVLKKVELNGLVPWWLRCWWWWWWWWLLLLLLLVVGSLVVVVVVVVVVPVVPAFCADIYITHEYFNIYVHSLHANNTSKYTKTYFYMYFKYICTYHGTYLPFSGIIVLSQIFVPSKSLDSRVSSGIVETGHHDKVSYP